MPTRQGAMLAKRISIWDRDSRSRSTMAPRLSRPTRWKVFLPMSTPSVAMAVDLALAMRIMGWAPCSCSPLSREDGERGRTIPLADVVNQTPVFGQQGTAHFKVGANETAVPAWQNAQFFDAASSITAPAKARMTGSRASDPVAAALSAGVWKSGCKPAIPKNFG